MASSAETRDPVRGKSKPTIADRIEKSTEKIKTGDNFWDSSLVADDPKHAQNYGRNIDKGQLKADGRFWRKVPENSNKVVAHIALARTCSNPLHAQRREPKSRAMMPFTFSHRGWLEL